MQWDAAVRADNVLIYLVRRIKFVLFIDQVDVDASFVERVAATQSNVRQSETIQANQADEFRFVGFDDGWFCNSAFIWMSNLNRFASSIW